MAWSDQEPPQPARIFTLAEATCLLPRLERYLRAAQQGHRVLLYTKEDIRKASTHAALGGGSLVGVQYIRALEQVYESLQAIHELGVIVKDVKAGLCDFPYHLNGRLVYLCWKLGEEAIHWWHEVDQGYAGRQALPSRFP
ncbi:MAG: DUF2203 family protein [Nitrospirae bacterium]|nr:MAG: DUF2203 family protein [Nitrospirota bacterium]